MLVNVNKRLVNVNTRIKGISKEAQEVIKANLELPIIIQYNNEEEYGDAERYSSVDTVSVVDYLEYETQDGEFVAFTAYDDFIEYLLNKYIGVTDVKNISEDDYCEFVKRKAAEWSGLWVKVLLLVCKE